MPVSYDTAGVAKEWHWYVCPVCGGRKPFQGNQETVESWCDKAGQDTQMRRVEDRK